MTIWVLSDGRAGHELQALGLADALGRLRPVETELRRVSLKPWVAKLPAQLSHGLGMISKDWPLSGLAEGAVSLCWPWPDLLISTGRRTAPVAAALKRRHGILTVQILDPKLPADAFDAVIAPRHDTLTGSTVFPTLGAMSRVTQFRIETEAEELAATLGEDLARAPRPRLGVLVGGPSKSAEFSEKDARQLCLSLRGIADTHTLLVTTSRRTPPELRAQLTSALGSRAFIWSPEIEGPNPYPGLLGHVDAVLVTEDSVNMASEAASTGLPVHVFPIKHLAPKLARFHEELTRHGATRRFTGALQSWTYAPLAEADRIAADLIRRGVL